MSFIGTWIVTSIACAMAIALVPGITAVGGSLAGPVVCALMLAGVNSCVKPIAQLLSLPLTVLTLGFFHLVVNALMLELAGWLSTNLFGTGIAISSLGQALLGAIIISLVSMLLSGFSGN